jgi:repressor LexA
LEFIEWYYAENGFPPSYREIQRHFGYKAVGTVQDHVRALIQKGVLEKPSSKNSKKARALIPSSHQKTKAKRIPIFGEIAAGGPREAIQTDLGSLVMGTEFAQGDCFALRVVGNSMVEIGMFEGDYVIVDRSQKVKSGDIVVALLEGEVTVKRYVEQKGRVFLVPENKNLKPIEIKTEQFQLQGKVTGLQRKIS